PAGVSIRLPRFAPPPTQPSERGTFVTGLLSPTALAPHQVSIRLPRSVTPRSFSPASLLRILRRDPDYAPPPTGPAGGSRSRGPDGAPNTAEEADRKVASTAEEADRKVANT